MYEELNEIIGFDRFKSDKDEGISSIIYSNFEIPEDFIRKHLDRLDLSLLLTYRSLSEEFIEELIRKKDIVNFWDNISIFQALSEPFIEKYKDLVNWDNISEFQTLSEDFIEKYKDYVSWRDISHSQALSEPFIEKYKDKVVWISISRHQVLSWKFILEHKNLVKWSFISSSQPFIDPEYYKINKISYCFNYLSKIYQITKDQGWFIGYLKAKQKNKNNHFITSPVVDFSEKIRIWWKDLVMIDIVKKYEPIRQFKYV